MQGRRHLATVAGAALAGLLALSGATAQDGAATAKVGQPAPDFSLESTEGKSHKLSEHKGKVVVLEWFNPDCPAVKTHHAKNKTMRDTAKRFAGKDVVWLAINSGAEGKQGAGVERNQRAIREYEIPYPVLLDPKGTVGRAYGARVTPHLVVIDAKGNVAYVGAVDNGNSRAVGDENHVAAAVDALLAGEAPKVAETRPYG